MPDRATAAAVDVKFQTAMTGHLDLRYDRGLRRDVFLDRLSMIVYLWLSAVRICLIKATVSAISPAISSIDAGFMLTHEAMNYI
ncbi:hypothetical protein HNQ77_001594 [Silvibacterium bohemicum]|uniref:Uncharacterized protein n=1 Tax=Silvibacterium bohemicum TaxID=1577686 RepID=A0A841JT29_9BACT|nr:hypothetical protein [Silvibacterium bohemicum]MBB6143645.1 hypothetical protein [Silvibacterium bohemicum]